MNKTCEKCIHYEVCRYPLEYRAFPDTCWKYEEPRPHGEWIKTTDGVPHLVTIEWFVCSQCGGQKSEETNFCPFCGADMRKEGEAE